MHQPDHLVLYVHVYFMYGYVYSAETQVISSLYALIIAFYGAVMIKQVSVVTYPLY